MIKFPILPSKHARRLAALVALGAAPLVAAGAQTISVNAGATGSTIIAPNAKLTVPIIVDLSAAGALNIAGLQSNITWGTARLTLDSIRAVVIAGWSFTPNTTNAPTGSSIFAAFGTAALGATSTIANAFFTASATTGGTRVMLAPTTAVSSAGASILSGIRARALDVCIGTAAKWGDVNDDGLVNISDAQQVARFSVGLSVGNLAAVLARGDVTADGLINISDAQQIARFSVGLPASPRLGTDIPITPATTAITVNPSAAQTLVIGSSRQVNATPVNGGTDLSGCAPVTWGSSNTAVATVNSSGYVTGLAAGTANITATSGAFSTQVTFNVTAVPVASVTLALAPTAIQIGTTSTGTATTRDAANNVLVGRVVTFSSGNTAVATVNATTGVVTGVTAGSATIFATSEGITGSATITVTTGVPAATVTVALGLATINVSATTTATATARDAGNNILGGKVPAWSSSNTGVATVNPTTGVVTGVSGGTANIIATIDGITGQAAVTVNAVPVASVTVALGAGSIQAGATTTATATTRDAANNVLTGRIVSFTSSNTAVATVGAFNGTVTGVAAGTATIFATSEGVTGQVTVTVTASGIVATVQVVLGSSNIQVGATTTATATLRDASNNIVSGPVTWSSSAPSIASVNASSGLVTALAIGQATITGTSGTKTGSANLTTSMTPVASVTVSLSPATVALGATSTATAKSFDANGVELFGRSVTWSTSNASEATVNAAGVVTPGRVGDTFVVATVENRIGQTELIMIAAPVATVSLTLASSSISVGASTGSTVVARDANNNVLEVTCTLTSSNTARATVNSSGVVTGVSAGSATITATCDSKTGTATVTVVNSPVASVLLSVAGGTIGVGGSTNAIATPRDAGGNALAGRVVTYASSNTSVVTINATTGVITGVALGNSNITATSEGVTSTAVAITVGTIVTHEPSGMVVVGEKPMNCVKPTACETEWGYWNESYANPAVLVNDPTAPTSPPNAVQMIYRPALSGGTSPVAIGKPLSPQKQMLYTRFTVKLSTNFQAHASGVNKKLHFFTAAGNNRAVFIIRGSGTTGTLVPSFLLQGLAMPLTYRTFGSSTTNTSTQQNLDADPSVCKTIRGQWHRYEMILTNNTPGVADGRAEIWMDGVKCIDVSGIGFVGAGENNTWQEVWWSPTWGGVFDAITTEFTETVDHLYLSGK